MSADVSVDKSAGVSVGVAMGASVNVSVGHRGLPWYAAGAAVEIAVEIAVASAMGLHGVPLLAAAFRESPWNVRGRPWKVRGSPWIVRGCPWNAVDMAVECRGGPWTLPRCSAKKRKNVRYTPQSCSTVLYLQPRCCLLTVVTDLRYDLLQGKRLVLDTSTRTAYQVRTPIHPCL